MVNLNFLGFGAQQTTHGSAKANIVPGVPNDGMEPVSDSSPIGFLPMFMNMLLGAAKAGQKSSSPNEGDHGMILKENPDQTQMTVSLIRNMYFKKITDPQKSTGEHHAEDQSLEERPVDECDGEIQDNGTEIIRRDDVSLLGLLASATGGEKDQTVEIEKSITAGTGSLSTVGNGSGSAKEILKSTLAGNFPLPPNGPGHAAATVIGQEENANPVYQKNAKVSGLPIPESLPANGDGPKQDTQRDGTVKAEGAEKQLNDGNKVHNEQGSPKNESRPKDDPAAGRTEQILRSAVPLPVHIAKDAGTENKSADNSKKDASGAVPEKGSVQTESPKINPAANSSSGRSSDESTKEEIGTAVDQSTFRKGTENTQTGIRFDETMAAVKIEKGTAPVEGKYYLHGSSKNDDMASFVIDQLSKHISHSIQEKSSEVKLILQPESLGEVTLHVKFEGGKVTTHMEVQQPQVKTVIESGIPALRESLESKGLTVGTIEVFSTQYSLNGKSSQHNQSRYPSRSPNRHGDEDEVFEQGKMLGYNTVEYIM